MGNNITRLKENIFYRAKIFIEDMGSFVPFGAKLHGYTVKDVMAYIDFEDSIEGVELINMMKISISSEIEKGLIKAGAVAYDVVVNLENAHGVDEKRDALCLIITEDGENWSQEIFPYLLINSQCVWE